MEGLSFNHLFIFNPSAPFFDIGTEYPISGILTELSVPRLASFSAVFEKLQVRNNELQNHA